MQMMNMANHNHDLIRCANFLMRGGKKEKTPPSANARMFRMDEQKYRLLRTLLRWPEGHSYLFLGSLRLHPQRPGQVQPFGLSNKQQDRSGNSSREQQER